MQDVTIADLVRAESDHMIRSQIEAFGLTFGRITQLREPMTPENQTVIRVCQDVLYSSTVLDLSEPVTITLPDAVGRFVSMLAISQDHSVFGEAQPGAYELTEDNVGTRFAYLLFRTPVDVTDPDDIAAAHAAQDRIEISGGGPGPFVAPNWNTDQLEQARIAVNSLSQLEWNSGDAFGRRDEVDPAPVPPAPGGPRGELGAARAAAGLTDVGGSAGKQPWYRRAGQGVVVKELW